MPGQIPTHVFTLICEDVRQEEFGKVSLLGIYSESIYFRFKDKPMRMRSLAFYSRFSGGHGTFMVRVKLKGSSGELGGVEIKDSRFPRSKDSEFTNLVMEIRDIEFREEGQHLYEIYFDDIPDPIAKFPFKVYVRPESF